MTARDLLSDWALELIEDQTKAKEFREEYQRLGVVQLDGFAKPTAMLEVGERYWSELSPIAKPSVQGHDQFKDGRINGLSPGFRFQMADPSRFRDEKRAELESKYRESGLVDLGDELGRMLAPLVEYVTGEALPYKRTFCFLYQEGDYISPHSDHQTGHRVNAQFPVPLNAVSGFRALEEDKILRVYYDTPGCLRILGPLVWHEVLPVLRRTETVEARRFLLSLRYMH